MKILCIVLSVYIMLISSVACKDGFVHENTKTQIVLTQDTDHAENPADLCSPFCTCTCCVSILQPAVAKSSSVPFSVQELNSPYRNMGSYTDQHPLFQPPQV